MEELNKKNSTSVLEFLVIFTSIIFNLNTLVVSSRMTSQMYAYISLFIYVCFFIWAIFIGKIKSINKRTIFLFFVFVISLFLTMAINNDFNILHFVVLLELFKAIVVYHIVDINVFKKNYVFVITALALYSLVMQMLIYLFPSILSLGLTYESNQGHIFKDYLLFFYENTESFRNFGFLSEPGDYQHYLNIGLIILLFNKKLFSKKQIKYFAVILSITAISTFSPIGVIFLLIVWVAYILRFKKNLKKMLGIILSVCLVFIIITQIPRINDGISYAYQKLTNTQSGSFKVRIIGIMSGFKAFFENPFFGLGYSHGTEVMENVFLSYGLKYNQTSTVSAYLAFFGVGLSLIAVLSYLTFFIKFTYNKGLMVSFFVIIGVLISINNERLVWELLFYIFLVYGFSEPKKNNEYTME